MRISDWSSDVCSSDLRHPALDHFEGSPGQRRRIVEAFRMGDAAPSSHPVDLAGMDGLLDAQTVAMRDPALEQVADGGESDVGMRPDIRRSEEHTSELQSLMRISYAVFCLKKKKTHKHKDMQATWSTD